MMPAASVASTDASWINNRDVSISDSDDTRMLTLAGVGSVTCTTDRSVIMFKLTVTPRGGCTHTTAKHCRRQFTIWRERASAPCFGAAQLFLT